MSLIVRPSCEALSRSITTVACGRVDLEIGVEEDEAAGGVRFLQELLRDVVQRLERPGRVDHELDRQAVEPGSGGGWKATTCAPAMPSSSP